MTQTAQQYLNALGADLELSEKMKRELDTLGFTISKTSWQDWLQEMRHTIDMLVEREGESLAIEHHQEEGVTRVANLINKGTVWEKVWAHPLALAACKHIFGGGFKISSLNAREAHPDCGHQPLHADWKKPRPDFPKVHLVNSIWAVDDLTRENGAPRIIPSTHLRKELPEELLDNVDGEHPDQVYLVPCW